MQKNLIHNFFRKRILVKTFKIIIFVIQYCIPAAFLGKKEDTSCFTYIGKVEAAAVCSPTVSPGKTNLNNLMTRIWQ
jgi:hypothetical protein